MKQALVNAMNEEQIIRYLLNELPEEEREMFEERSLADRQLFEYMQAVEDDLADEYARGRLSAERRHRFEQIYYAMPGGRERIAFASELNDILDEYNAVHVPKTEVATKRPIREFFDSLVMGWQSWAAKYRLSFAVPAIAIFLAVLAAIGGYEIVILNRQLQKAEASLRQAHPNPPPSPGQLSAQGGDLVAVVPIPRYGPRVPASVREGGGKNGNTTDKRGAVRIMARGKFVELRFEISPQEFGRYISYSIELNPVQSGADNKIILEDLKAHNTTRRPELTVLLPVSRFPANTVTNYTLTFRVRSKDGTEEKKEEFPVEVDTKEQ